MLYLSPMAPVGLPAARCREKQSTKGVSRESQALSVQSGRNIRCPFSPEGGRAGSLPPKPIRLLGAVGTSARHNSAPKFQLAPARTHAMSSSTPRGGELVSPKQNGTEEDEGWSDGEDDAELAAEGGDRKRKRPMSVSCELCKQRKVSIVLHPSRRLLNT